MTVASASQASRRLSVMAQINRELERLNALQEEDGLAPVDCVAGQPDRDRLRQVEGLLGAIRGWLVFDGEVSQRLVLAAGVQVVAWLVALEERDEQRIDAGEDE